MTTEWWRGHSDRTITDMKKIIIIFFVILLSYSHSWATDINCSSSSTVQTAINNAANGDTIRCNASGSYNWSSTVTVPNSGTKGITLDGGGATISGHVSIMSSATYNSRVTGFHFTSTGSVSTGNGYTNKPWRIDNCVFTGNTVDDLTCVNVTGAKAGLSNDTNAHNVWVGNNSYTEGYNLGTTDENAGTIGY